MTRSNRTFPSKDKAHPRLNSRTEPGRPARLGHAPLCPHYGLLESRMGLSGIPTTLAGGLPIYAGVLALLWWNRSGANRRWQGLYDRIACGALCRRAVKPAPGVEPPSPMAWVICRQWLSLQTTSHPGRDRTIRQATSHRTVIIPSPGLRRSMVWWASLAKQAALHCQRPANRARWREVMQQFHKALAFPGEVVFHEAYAHEATRNANQRLFGRGRYPALSASRVDLILSFGLTFSRLGFGCGVRTRLPEMHHRLPNTAVSSIYNRSRLSMTRPTPTSSSRFAGQEYRAAMMVSRKVARLKDDSTADTSQSGAVDPRLQDVLVDSLRRRMASHWRLGCGDRPGREPHGGAMLLNQLAAESAGPLDYAQVHALGQTAPAAKVEELLARPHGGLRSDRFTKPIVAYSLPRLGQVPSRRPVR